MAKVAHKKLLLSELQPGMRVKLPLSWTNHPFLFNRVDINSAAQIEMIRGLGVPFVYLISGSSDDAEAVDEEEEIEEIDEVPPERDLKADTRKSM
ncbi:MAG: DUF3391 domain-containing protein, partial [Shewanella sp.]